MVMAVSMIQCIINHHFDYQENELTSISGGGNLSDLQDLHVSSLKTILSRAPGGGLMMILALRMAMQCFLLSQIHITSLLTFPHQSDLKTQIKTARYLSISLFIKKADSLWPLVVCLSVRRQRTLNERISRTIESLSCLRCRKSLTI